MKEITEKLKDIILKYQKYLVYNQQYNAEQFAEVLEKKEDKESAAFILEHNITVFRNYDQTIDIELTTNK